MEVRSDAKLGADRGHVRGQTLTHVYNDVAYSLTRSGQIEVSQEPQRSIQGQIKVGLRSKKGQARVQIKLFRPAHQT